MSREDSVSLHALVSGGNKSSVKKFLDTATSQSLDTKDHFGRTPLILSVVYSQPDCTSLLLKAGAQVNNTDGHGQTALHIAVYKGNHHCMKLLLVHGADWHAKDFCGVTALHLAAMCPNLKCLSTLLKEVNPGEIDIQDSNRKTALHWSAAYCNVEHIKMLIAQGANLCIPDEEGKTPLHWAATNKDDEACDCIKILLEKERSLINWQDYDGRSALHLAVASGSMESVNFLASRKNCVIDILDNAFNTPLHWAAKEGLAEKADILLKCGASHTSADDHGATPLHYAAFNNNLETVLVFLSRNYIKDVTDSDGRTALMWAASKNAASVIGAMANCGINVAAADKIGFTALHAAAIKGHKESVEVLLKSGAPIDAVDGCGLTPLLRASKHGRTNIADLLIESGADVHKTDCYGRTIFHWCTMGGHAYLCQVLLNKGVTCNMQDVFGMTPLHYASMHGFINCICILLESGTNIDCVDEEGKTALYWAVLKSHFSASRLLCEYNADVNLMTHGNDCCWETSLDCAHFRKNPDIAKLLYEFGGQRAREMKEAAATVIQCWYRKMKRQQRKSLLKVKASVDVEDHRCPLADIRCHVEDMEAESGEVEKDKSDDLCLSGIGAYDRDVVERSAGIVQKAWRRYYLKSRFAQMRERLSSVFVSEDSRKKAEKKWQDELNSFYEIL